jgi:hypothetical protein
MRRLMKELDTWNNTESAGEQGIERLGPVSDEELLSWEAVINGRGVGHGYESAFPSLLFPPVPPFKSRERVANMMPVAMTTQTAAGSSASPSPRPTRSSRRKSPLPRPSCTPT